MRAKFGHLWVMRNNFSTVLFKFLGTNHWDLKPKYLKETKISAALLSVNSRSVCHNQSFIFNTGTFTLRPCTCVAYLQYFLQHDLFPCTVRCNTWTQICIFRKWLIPQFAIKIIHLQKFTSSHSIPDDLTSFIRATQKDARCYAALCSQNQQGADNHYNQADVLANCCVSDGPVTHQEVTVTIFLHTWRIWIHKIF